jgi:hypothetical protein
MRDGVLLDLRASAAYRKAHVEGARWSIRPRLASAVSVGKPHALMADARSVAQLAAIDLTELGIKDIRYVDATLEQCQAAGLALVSTPDQPSDAERIDFLFFVHDRHEGNRAAMRGYLQWETGLLKQLDEQERASFKLPAAH